jgi:hypothetical protein
VVSVEENIHAAVKALLQCLGLGGMRPNTVLLGLSHDPNKAEVFYETISTVKEMKRSLIIVACEQAQEKVEVPDGAINLWWDTAANFELMLLLAFMLTKNREWRDHRIRVIRPVAPKADIVNIESEMRAMFERARIDAELVVMPSTDPIETVRWHMAPSAVLFVGFEPDADVGGGDLLARLHKAVALHGDIVFVYNAGGVSLEA